MSDSRLVVRVLGFHNSRVQRLALLWMVVAGLALGGCSTSSSGRLHTASTAAPKALDSGPFSTTTVLAPEPAIAPAPGQPPTWSKPGIATQPRRAAVSNAPPAIVAPEPFAGETWVGLQRWAAQMGVAGSISLPASPAATCQITSPQGVLILKPGSFIATWNGVSIWLAHPFQIVDGAWSLHSVDLRKVLGPLLRDGAGLQLPASPLLVLDPGHGGVDSGTTSPQGEEKTYTLDWALRTAALLRDAGWRVLLTRTNDVEVSLADRVALANASGADLFVSLHFNSAGGQERHEGLETYYLTPAGVGSSITRDYADDPRAIFPNNAFDETNVRLAVAMHQALLAVTGGSDRGVRRARFMTVLRQQTRPAILLEGGYLSNRREAANVADPAHRQKLAAALAGALLKQSAAGNSPTAISNSSP